MSAQLHILPDRQGSAAENMAHDFLMLQRYRPAEAIRLRHYGWRRPAYTFGLSQRVSFVESEVPEPGADLCRRPTGGGVVNHLDDWTYGLVIPPASPLGRGQPIDIYRTVHEAIAAAMESQGANVILNLQAPEDASPGVCFNKPELFDVVLANMPSKVAGAAQKRAKAGLLMQGSIWRPTVSQLSWERFYNDFILALAERAEAAIEYVSWPEWRPEEEEALVAQFESEEWNRRR